MYPVIIKKKKEPPLLWHKQITPNQIVHGNKSDFMKKTKVNPASYFLAIISSHMKMHSSLDTLMLFLIYD